MLLLIFAALLLVSIALIPLGLPGIWVMLASAVGYNVLAGGGRIGMGTLVGVAILGVAAEVIDFLTSARYAERYGGSRRAGWGAIIGGFVGALVGVPVPVVGSVIGGFIGSFVGAFVAEWTRRDSAASPTRVATGAIIGRAVGAAIKVAFALVMAVWLFVAAWR